MLAAVYPPQEASNVTTISRMSSIRRQGTIINNSQEYKGMVQCKLTLLNIVILTGCLAIVFYWGYRNSRIRQFMTLVDF